jgi:tRNA-specific 2-thiouridylase
VRDPEGKLLGRHNGLMFYTIGQRQGLGIGGSRGGDGDPWYVTAKDMERNRLVVVQGHDHPSLYTDRVNAVDLSWISGSAPHCNWVYTAKTRYRQKDAPCAIVSTDGGRCVVEFAEPQWAVTPGQSIVVYESQVCLGGGVIES